MLKSRNVPVGFSATVVVLPIAMLHEEVEVTLYESHQSRWLTAKEYCVALVQTSWTTTSPLSFVMLKQYIKRLVFLMLGGCSHLRVQL